ncbi:MAG: TIM barrel protein, partial [Gemmatimonadaceae bacterium]
VTKEAPNHVYEALKPFIRHTHIKDVKLTGSGVQYVLFGTGEAPVGEALRALKDGGYGGFYSFEWEKRWHPEIEAPEIALAQYPAAVQRSLASGGR